MQNEQKFWSHPKAGNISMFRASTCLVTAGRDRCYNCYTACKLVCATYVLHGILLHFAAILSSPVTHVRVVSQKTVGCFLQLFFGCTL